MLRPVSYFSIIICFLGTMTSSFAQNKLTSSELSKVENLIKEKHSLESSNELKSTYKLQIFSGTMEEAKKTQEDFQALELEMSSKIIYQTPYYKIWIGDYRSRIQADRAYEKVKSEYPNTLIIRPGK